MVRGCVGVFSGEFFGSPQAEIGRTGGLVPAERHEVVAHGVPGRFPELQYYKWKYNEHQGAGNQYGEPYRIGSHIHLARGEEAEYERHKRTHESHTCYEPHHNVAALAEPVWPRSALHFVAQAQGRGEHEQIGYQVEYAGKLREYLVEALHRGHKHHEERKDCDYSALHIEYVFLHTVLVGPLEELRQIACLTHSEHTFGRSRNPCEHAGEHTECQSNGDNR